MENIENHLKFLHKNPLSVIVRSSSKEQAWTIIKYSITSGIKFVEITLTIPNAYELIQKSRLQFPDVIIGAGTVLTLEEAKLAIKNNAQYLVSPVFNLAILKWANANDILYIPGAMTVNEMYQAFSSGAHLIKVYPVITLKPEIIKLIAQPFPKFKLLATGGININNMFDYFESGIYAVGVTFPVENTNKEQLATRVSEQAKHLCEKVSTIIAKRELKSDN